MYQHIKPQGGHVMTLKKERTSKEHLHPQLHLASKACAKDATEIRCEGDPVGHIEVHMIEEIEYLPPELEPRPVPNWRRIASSSTEATVKV